MLSVIPLSVVVLWRQQTVLIGKTYEVCSNLGANVANLATEELLIDETYDATGIAMAHLRKSEISGLLDSFVINLEGKIVAGLKPEAVNTKMDQESMRYFMSLPALELSEIRGGVLRYAYPIFVISYEKEKIRVGTAVFLFDREEVLAPVRNLRNSIVLVALVLLGLGLVIGLLAAVYFSRPIQVLSDGARIIGEGDLSHRIAISNKDEIGDLARSFNKMTSQIQDFTQNLEQKVQDRTVELNRALEEVTALKVQQDGDYFLTSLLMEPLSRNASHIECISTDMLIEQKKKFRFKHWASHIGGDICLTDTIPIGKKDYVIFANADAMGKSIQGAGGALVLGAVFRAILVRSRVARHQSRYPEAWLRDTFLDLHSIFASFDGTMYMSLVMGLIDEAGNLYYVNAEHPFVVLYRGGQATFLDNSTYLRKLGIPGQEDHLAVRLVHLEPGDVVISGSDGRDDLLTHKEGVGEVMNEDETEFLRRVEEGQGDLQKIGSCLKEFGTLVDDLSLIRIGYREHQPAETVRPHDHVTDAAERSRVLLEQENNEEALALVSSVLDHKKDFPDLLKWAGILYFRKGEFVHAGECFESYLELRPGDDEIVYMMSHTLQKLEKWNEAADLGERLFLRSPDHELNLLSLGSTYMRLGEHQRAQKMLRRCLDVNPDNEPAHSLLNEMAPPREMEAPEQTDLEEMQRLVSKGDMHYKARGYSQAFMAYRDALRIVQDHEWSLFRAANCLARMDRLDEAVVHYNRVIMQNRDHVKARNNVATVYHRMKRPDEAQRQLRRALSIKEDFRVARRNLARLESGEPTFVA